MLALIVGVVALARFYARKNNTFLFLGAGFIGAALIDGYHTIVTSSFSEDWSSLASPAGSWSWSASRTFLAVMVFLSWWESRGESKLGDSRVTEHIVFGVAGLLSVTFLIVFSLYPLPSALLAERAIHRPQELVSAGFFLAALIGYLSKGAWKHSTFEHWLVISLFLGFFTQAIFMLLSPGPIDPRFVMAHVLKAGSYLSVLVGLVISMHALFVQAEGSADQLKKVNRRLTEEISARQSVQEQLEGMNVSLEGCVAERTEELSSANKALESEIQERRIAQDRIQRHLSQVTALRTIDCAIAGNLDLRATLNVFLDQAVAHLHVDAVDLLLVNPRTELLEYVGGRGFRTEALIHTRLRIGEGHAGRAAAEQKLIAVADVKRSPGSFLRAPFFGKEEFVDYYAVPLIAKGKVKGVLEIYSRTPLGPGGGWVDFFEALTAQAAIALDNAMLFGDLQRANTDLVSAYDSTLEGWARALDLRDKETEGHSQRVTAITVELAEEIGVPNTPLIDIRRGALLHDIGKMAIPDYILHKPGTLTDEEMNIMREHPSLAHQMLSPIEFLQGAIDIPYCHHEKLDGTGYPNGLKGDVIPLPARIFAIVDVWDALSSDRPYRKAWPQDRVIEHIKELSGTHFDPAITKAFFEYYDRAGIASRFQSNSIHDIGQSSNEERKSDAQKTESLAAV
jgi:putative nucleotidyltransferase with HDIG domain